MEAYSVCINTDHPAYAHADRELRDWLRLLSPEERAALGKEVRGISDVCRDLDRPEARPIIPWIDMPWTRPR